MDYTKISTLGELKKSGYKTKKVKEELRDNLILNLQAGKSSFVGIYGYENTVVPDLERAILSGHNINLLGLRGQAKTRLARMMIGLLDEYIPVIHGSELNEDPFSPITLQSQELIAELGDKTPISWMHRDKRYVEKLATPDVSVADLIGDIDPIKAANLKVPYSDPRALHYGLVPRSNRCLMVINEIPDLQPRIQVALFNILQEGDVQIRGFNLRLNLDIQFVFTANPEDYTNRGSIITPLKDRIGSQILTHYPRSISDAKQITQQEAKISKQQKVSIIFPDLAFTIAETIPFKARESEFVDPKSGVSARLSISMLENIYSAAERRMLINNESQATIRITDFIGAIAAITGKIEMVYEGEQEGTLNVANNLMVQAIKEVFVDRFGLPKKSTKGLKQKPEYQEIVSWFESGNLLEIPCDISAKEYKKLLSNVTGLESLVNLKYKDLDENEKWLYMEFVLHGLAAHSRLSKHFTDGAATFKDLFDSVFNLNSDIEDDD